MTTVELCDFTGLQKSLKKTHAHTHTQSKWKKEQYDNGTWSKRLEQTQSIKCGGTLF